jgi:hypothetical protein
MKECKHCEFSREEHEFLDNHQVDRVINNIGSMIWYPHPFEPVEEGRTFKNCTIEYDKISFGLEMLRRIESLESRIEPKVASRLETLAHRADFADNSIRELRDTGQEAIDKIDWNSSHLMAQHDRIKVIEQFIHDLKKAAGGK